MKELMTTEKILDNCIRDGFMNQVFGDKLEMTMKGNMVLANLIAESLEVLKSTGEFAIDESRMDEIVGTLIEILGKGTPHLALVNIIHSKLHGFADLKDAMRDISNHTISN